jgi:hypothetical protein
LDRLGPGRRSSGRDNPAGWGLEGKLLDKPVEVKGLALRLERAPEPGLGLFKDGLQVGVLLHAAKRLLGVKVACSNALRGVPAAIS